MAKDINKKPYDEATLTKLEIFEQYLLEWLPVFIHTPYTGKVMICDFCAGSGQDSEGVPGSPLRILRTIEKCHDMIFQQNISIDVILNEAKPDKSDELQIAVDSCFDQSVWGSKVKVSCYRKEFQDLFREQYDQLKQQPNLLFIDQYGIKEVTDEIFQMLINLQKTDFLFFISSSTIKRFASLSEFKDHLPDLDVDNINSTKWSDSHRVILDYYRKRIPTGNSTKLYPFSLKKEENGNIYGLIFGSKNLLGVQKFLDIAWDKNRINGEANFDIDDDVNKSKPTLFDTLPDYECHKRKKELYEVELENFIVTKKEVTNLDVWTFTLSLGHPRKHARESIRNLRTAGKIICDSQIGFSYQTCIKNNKIKTIKAKING